LNYKVLYRKYRPDDFKNIVDQNYTIEILKNAIITNKISHAYIFAGPRGTGKTTTAKVFAKSINCEHFNENGPCGKCFNCENFNNNPDIIEIDAASNNGVDEIRELINSVKLAPTNSKYKVYIIDEVHMLSQSAFNALLLTLEEPPKHVVFILATTNIESVPVTILSRCQRFDFKKISDNEIIKRMQYICSKENIEIEEDALAEIAYLADGGMRDALSILDQLSAISSKITLDGVISHFGSISMLKINEIIDALESSNTIKVINIIDEFRKSSVDYKNLIKKLLDVLYKKAISAKEDCNYQGLSYKDLKSLSFDLVDCLNKINVIIDPFMLIEMTLLNYTKEEFSSITKTDVLTNSTADKIETVVNSDEKSQLEVEENVDTKKLDNEFKNIRINNCFVNAKKEYLTEIKNNWSKYLENLKEDRHLLALVVDANPVAASDKYIILSTNLFDAAELINRSVNDLEEEYNKLFNKKYKFVALSEVDWDVLKKEYVNNLRSGKTYDYIEEVMPVLEDSNDNQIEKIAKDIFEQEKIEIN